MTSDDHGFRLSPADRRSAEDAVTDALRSAIRNGELAPGSRLAQAELAEQLGVSRIPLRDALRRLEVEALVRIDGRKGAFVTALDPDEVAEIYEMRILLEQTCVRRALEHLQAEDVDRLVGLSETMDRHLGEAVDGAAARRTFYEALYDYADRPHMARTILQLRDNVSRYHILLDREHSHQAHEELRECIRARDPERAAHVVRRHLEEARDDLLNRLDPPPEQQGESPR